MDFYANCFKAFYTSNYDVKTSVFITGGPCSDSFVGQYFYLPGRYPCSHFLEFLGPEKKKSIDVNPQLATER